MMSLPGLLLKIHLIYFAIYGCHGTDQCTWGDMFCDSVNRSVGSSGVFSVIAGGEAAFADERFSWFFDERSVSTFRYNHTAGNFYEFIPYKRGQASASVLSNTSYAMNITIMTLGAEDNGKELFANRQACSLSRSKGTVLAVTYCPDLCQNKSEFLKINKCAGAEYMQRVTYSCKSTPANRKSAIVVKGDYGNSETAYNRTCMYNALWNGTDEVICAYEPSPIIKINGGTENTFSADSEVNFSCVGDLGNPRSDEPTYHLKNMTGGTWTQISPEYDLTYKDDGASVACQATNKYTVSMADCDKCGFSNSITLNVEYGPMEDPHGSSMSNESVGIGEQVELVFRFIANPPATSDNIKLYFSGSDGNKELNVSQSDLAGENPQTYTHVINKVENSSYGLYLLQVESPSPEFSKLLDLKIYLKVPVSTTVPPGTTAREAGTPLSPGIIAAIGVAVGLVVILIIMLVFLKVRRQKQAESETSPPPAPVSLEHVDRQEKENPLYGTARNNVNYDKEERANPLYGTAGGFTEEATYSSVDKQRKKGKKKGKENEGFSDVGDTYAEVKKPKKNKPDAAMAEEVTYAALNKKKKGPNQNVLHGSSDAEG